MAQMDDVTISDASVKILVINPNSSKVMTEGLDELIATLKYSNTTEITTYTAPSGPSSINNEDDALKSAVIVRDDLSNSGLLTQYSAYLVCCYSVHPLITMLRSVLPASVPVLGIFEASVSTSLGLLNPPVQDHFESFGIVSTGKYWEEVLANGVAAYLGVENAKSCKRFAGVQTTGLDAGELHRAPMDLVAERMKEAVKRLVSAGDVRAVCLGCAGMAGMDEMVREACIEELGEDRGASVHIVDGVKAGIAMLDGLVRSKTVK